MNIGRIINGKANDFNEVHKFTKLLNSILEILHYLGVSDSNIHINYKDSENDSFFVTIKQTDMIDIMIIYHSDLVEVVYNPEYKLDEIFIDNFSKKNNDTIDNIVFSFKK